jgi:hypothetical protein
MKDLQNAPGGVPPSAVLAPLPETLNATIEDE